MLTQSDHHIIQSWCLRELMFWRNANVHPDKVTKSLVEANATYKTIFMLEINNGVVSISNKDEFYTREELDDPSSTNSSIIRINAYRSFIETAIGSEENRVKTTLALDTEDIPPDRDDFPLFGYQKKFGNPTIMLPDIDLVRNGFYHADIFSDPYSYDEKVTEGIFVGSTTGGGIITKKSVEALAVSRIKSAVYFKENPHVDFRVPNIVQCDSQETDGLIRALGICGEVTSFQDQLQRKFIISMDGNGATCSRVAITLKSNSVLLKYDSAYLLHYFDKMLPWLHYIPIYKDEDVENVINLERSCPGYFDFIAQEGKNFFDRFLGKAMVLKYTSELIGMYANIVSGQPIKSMGGTPNDANATRLQMDDSMELRPILHVQNVGDVRSMNGSWVGSLGSKSAIEGFALHPTDGYLHQNLEYKAIFDNHNSTEWLGCGTFCGSRGNNTPIKGFGIRIGGAEADEYKFTYQATCIDGSKTAVVSSGEICSGASFLPLEALRIEVVRRSRTAIEYPNSAAPETNTTASAG
jgi:hypothetical protein